MSLDRDSRRIVIAGASSLLGTELKSLLEEGRFAASDFRLLDEEFAAGTLTEAGGEAVVIQPVEEGSFARAAFVFFTGTAGFTRANVNAARSSGANVIDLSGAALPASTCWFPELAKVHGTAATEPLDPASKVFSMPSAAAGAVSSLCLSLNGFGLRQLTFLAFQPVSEFGRLAIEELESQTSHLLSFQPIGKAVFDEQVAFTLLDRFGPASSQDLAAARARLRAETRSCLGALAGNISLQLLHAPVFYGTTFAVCALLDPAVSSSRIEEACKSAGFVLSPAGEAPGNISVAGESTMRLAQPEPEGGNPGGWWLWGAADNLRWPAHAAARLAEKLA